MQVHSKQTCVGANSPPGINQGTYCTLYGYIHRHWAEDTRAPGCHSSSPHLGNTAGQLPQAVAYLIGSRVHNTYILE